MQRELRIGLACLGLLLLGASVAAPAGAKPKGKPKKTKMALVSVTATPGSLAAGQSIAVTATVVNRGKADGSAPISLSLRSAQTGAATAFASERTRVKKHKRKTVVINAAVPGATAAGDYTVFACVKRSCANSGRVTVTKPPLPPCCKPAGDFKPGARTAGDPLLPQIGNGGYDALHYDVALDYDRSTNLFKTATTTMTARALQDLSQLSLDFQPFAIDSVTVDGEPAAFAQDGPDEPLGDPSVVTQPKKLRITPAAGIPDGDQFAVAVTYHGEPHVFVDPDESFEGWIPDCFDAGPGCTGDSNFVVGEPMGAQAWFPSNNHPSDRASIDTHITVNAGDKAFGAGELVGAPVNNDNGTTTWNWSEDQPIPTYLTTATNGAFTYTQVTAHETLTDRMLPIYNAIDPDASPAQLVNYGVLNSRDASLIDFLGERFGAYPFDSYGVVFDDAPQVGYALEVATKSHFSSLPAGSGVGGGTASTYLHELSHMWFGDAVTVRDWHDIWFNEGWAQFAEWEYGHEFAGGTDTPEDQFHAVYDPEDAIDWSLAPAVLDGDPAELFNGDATYTRSGAMIEGFRMILGDDEQFFGFAQSIQSQFADGNISTDDFIALAEAASGFTGERLALLDAYFQQWLFGTEKPAISPADFA